MVAYDTIRDHIERYLEDGKTAQVKALPDIITGAVINKDGSVENTWTVQNPYLDLIFSGFGPTWDNNYIMALFDKKDPYKNNRSNCDGLLINVITGKYWECKPGNKN